MGFSFFISASELTDLSIKDRKNHIDSVINKIKTNYSDILVENIEYNLLSDFEIDDKQISIVRGEA